MDFGAKSPHLSFAAAQQPSRLGLRDPALENISDGVQPISFFHPHVESLLDVHSRPP